MVVAVRSWELALAGCHSLKDKRRIVKSLKDRLHHQFNVSAAEVDHQDAWQRATIAAVTVSGDHVYAEKVLAAVEGEAAAMLGRDLADATVEWL